MGEIGNIWVRLGADVSNFEKNMSAAEKAMVKVGDRFQKIGKTLSIAGAAITASMSLIILKTANLGDEFYDLSQRTGIAVETLSSFKLAADKSGTSIGGFATGMKGLSRVMFEAASGGKEAKEAFSAVGVSATDSAGNLRPLDQVMLDVADRFATMPDGAEKSALAMKLFGKSGMDLIPMLNLGRKGLEANVEQMKKFGIVTTEEAKAGDAFNDAMTEMQAATGGLTRTIGNALIPSLTNLATKIADAISKLTAFAKEHPLLTKVIGGAVLGIGGFLTALGSLSYAFGTVLKELPKLKSGFNAIKALASQTIVFTFAIAGAAIVAATIAKMIADFKKLREAGASTAEALRSQFLNFNPFKSMSREGLGKFLTDMDAARDKSISVKGAIALLGEAFKAIKGSIEGGTTSLVNFGEALKTLGIKTKTELTAELKAAEEALKAFRGSAEATPGQVKALEDKIVALKEAMSGVKVETKSLAEQLGITFRADTEAQIKKLNEALVTYRGKLTADEIQRIYQEINTLTESLTRLKGPVFDLDQAIIKMLNNLDFTAEEVAAAISGMFSEGFEDIKKAGEQVLEKDLPSYLKDLPVASRKAAEATKSIWQECSTVIADSMRNIASAIVGAFNFKGLFGAVAIDVKFDSSTFDAMVAAAKTAYDQVKTTIESSIDTLRAATDKEIDLIKAQYDKMVNAARAAYDAVEARARAAYDKVEERARAAFDAIEENTRRAFDAEDLLRSRAEQDADIRRSRHEAYEDRKAERQYKRDQKSIKNSTMTEAQKASALRVLERKYEKDKIARDIAREDARLARERKREDKRIKEEIKRDKEKEARERAYDKAKEARERAYDKAKEAREMAFQLKLEGIRAAQALAEETARTTAATKEATFLADLLALQNQHQLDLDAIRVKEDLARQKQADAEEKRQNSLWFKVKGIFATACENMATIFLTKMFEPIGNLIGELAGKLIGKGANSLGGALDGVGGKVKGLGATIGEFITGIGAGIGGFISGLATGVASAVTVLATAIGGAIVILAESIATAAASLAAAAPELLIVGAIAIAIYAGFLQVKTIWESIASKIQGGGSSADVTYWLKLQWELLQNSYNFYVGELTGKLDAILGELSIAMKPALWAIDAKLLIIANAIDAPIKTTLWSINEKAKVANGYLKTSTGYLKTIASVIQNIKPAAVGYSGVVSTPTLFLAGERGAERVQITPTRQGNTQPAIYIRPVVIPRGDKYIIEFLTDAMRHGQMRVPTGAVGGA